MAWPANGSSLHDRLFQVHGRLSERPHSRSPVRADGMMSSDIIQATRRILDLRSVSTAPLAEWDDARRDFADLLSLSTDPAQLQAALDMDADHLLLPVN